MTSLKRTSIIQAGVRDPDYNKAVQYKLDMWVAASGGFEQPFDMKGRKLLWCFNPAKRRHAYLDVDTDTILSDEEALALFAPTEKP